MVVYEKSKNARRLYTAGDTAIEDSIKENGRGAIANQRIDYLLKERINKNPPHQRKK